MGPKRLQFACNASQTGRVHPSLAPASFAQEGPSILRTASGWSGWSDGPGRIGHGIGAGMFSALRTTSGRSLSGLSIGSGDNVLARLESTNGDSLGFGRSSRGGAEGFDALEQQPGPLPGIEAIGTARDGSAENQGLFPGTKASSVGSYAILPLRAECSMDSCASDGSARPADLSAGSHISAPGAAAMMSAAPFGFGGGRAPWDPPSGKPSIPVGDSGPFASQLLSIAPRPATTAPPLAPVPEPAPALAPAPAPARPTRKPRARAAKQVASTTPPVPLPARSAKRGRAPAEAADVLSTPSDTGSTTPMSAAEVRRATGKAPTGSKTSERPYCCSVRGCGKRFRSKSDLVAHNRVHTGEKPLRCKFAGCGKSFAHCSNLRQHERSHQGIKPYKCGWPGCGKEFAHPTSKKDHEAKHRNERLHVCDHCGKSFTAKANLTRHKKDIHKVLPPGSKKARSARAAAQPGGATAAVLPVQPQAVLPMAAAVAGSLPVSQPAFAYAAPPVSLPTHHPSAPWDAPFVGRVVTTSLLQAGRRR